jgi:modulator of FtsH protease HflK
MNPQDPNVPPPSAAAPPAEDAGSQALAEALRSSFIVVQVIMVGLVLLFLSSGFFTIGPQEKGIILRMGKPANGGELLGPGAHWAWPAPIDEVVRLHITSVTNAESSAGWYLSPAERLANAPPIPFSKLNPAMVTYALTADTNIIHVRATALYTVSDPMAFNFSFTDAPSFITNALNNALLRACSEYTVDGILTSNRAEWEERVQQQANELVEAEHLGITLGQVTALASPPIALQDKFREVDKAVEMRHTAEARAQTYQTTNLAWASGEADTRVKVADAARKRKVDMMAAQADTFSKLLNQYERNPELFKRIRQMAVLEDIYTNAQDKIVMPPNAHEYRFELNREPQAPTVNIPTQP